MSHSTIPWRMAGPLVAVILLASCGQPSPDLLHGYVEGEFVYVSSPLGGRITKLHVQRGVQVSEGSLLFELENIEEKAARDEADHRLQQARATLEDAKKGRRPSELESLQAQLKQAREALALSEKELVRQTGLRSSGAVAEEAIDQARSTNVQNRHRVEQLDADLKTAQLGLRIDQINAAESEVRAREAALATAEWELSQKQQKAPQAGLINDTLYREGEWVAAARPVISLLPPANLKVRTFVPETRIAKVHEGDTVKVTVDGMPGPLTGRVSFISPQVEYTPPVIYSQENRNKFVFMVELRFDDAIAVKLHPGQPVDVELKPRP